VRGLRAIALGILAVAALAAPAVAKVTSSGQSGFAVAHEADVAATPQAAFDAFVAISKWWSSSHTWSGDAKNLSIDLKSGCWCETLPNGGYARHMNVVMSDPGKSLTFQGGLGPLMRMGVAGAMTVTFEPKGAGTHITLTYAVGGYDTGNFSGLSKGVDGVLAEQFKSYLATLAKP
jgi:hypothetical protein